jgi:murein tripeptide amidase MpaA
MLNPDGVAVGNYRTDAAGADLNRMWLTSNKLGEPSVHAALGVLQHYYGDAGEGVGVAEGIQKPQMQQEQQGQNKTQQQQEQHLQEREQVRMFIDIHAHSTSRSSFLFCNPPDNATVVLEGGRREPGANEAAATTVSASGEGSGSIWRRKTPVCSHAQDAVHALPK